MTFQCLTVECQNKIQHEKCGEFKFFWVLSSFLKQLTELDEYKSQTGNLFLEDNEWGKYWRWKSWHMMT